MKKFWEVIITILALFGAILVMMVVNDELNKDSRIANLMHNVTEVYAGFGHYDVGYYNVSGQQCVYSPRVWSVPSKSEVLPLYAELTDEGVNWSAVYIRDAEGRFRKIVFFNP